MGQKVNPNGLRIGIIRTWDSVWYMDKKNFAKSLHEDIKIREFVNKFSFGGDEKNKAKSTSGEIAKIEIYRKPDRITVIINSSRPGVIIGSNGENILAITKMISKITSLKVEVKIKEIKKPEINSQLIASNVAKQIQNRIPFRKAMKKAISDAKKSGINGIKIQCSGRLGGADMARREWYRDGRIPLHTLRADVDYGSSTAFTTYGTTGIKVWIFNKEILKKDIKEDAGQIIKKAKKGPKKSEE
jgi:small subunit ribosomal protein S3